MNNLYAAFFILAIFTSCSKKNDAPVAVVLPDTLSAGWTKITSLPKENFRDIFFPGNTTGFAVSAHGIYKSNDAGNNWAKINADSNIYNIGAGDNNTACFPENSGITLATQDGGTTFSNSSYPAPAAGIPSFTDCFFSSAATCYITSALYMWKSTNRGLSLDSIYYFQNRSLANSLFFLDDQRGWVLRQDGIYRTTDAGNAWDLIKYLTGAYGSVQFLDNDNGYFSNYGEISKTTDGGINWTPVFESPLQDYADIAFINVNEGYFSLANRLYKTTDAGSTWNVVAALGNENFTEIHFTDAAHGWACTTDGVVLKFIQ